MQCICGPFILEFIREILSTSMFFSARFTLRQPKHYELQCCENPMKMSLKTEEGIFQGPEYRYFIFMAYFSGHEFAMKS